MWFIINSIFLKPKTSFFVYNVPYMIDGEKAGTKIVNFSRC